MKNIIKISIAILSVFVPFTNWAQIEGTNAFLMGPSIEIGIHNNGYEGSSVGPAGPDHARLGPRLGFVANPEDDAWTNYDGDYYLPGSPENTFGIQIDGIDYQNSASPEYDIPAVGVSDYEVIGKCKMVQWNGSVGGIDINLLYKLDTTTTYYTVDVTLVNTNAVDKSNIYFYKTFDPDNNQTIGWNFVTFNEIESQPSPFCSKSIVSATQINSWTSYVGLGAIDPQIRVSKGNFAVAQGDWIYNASGPGMTGVVGPPGGLVDEAISICKRIPTFRAGATENFQFVVILDASQVEEAIQSLYYVDFDGGLGASASCLYEDVPDTIDFDCGGSSVELSFDGPFVGPAYDIYWYNDDTGEEIGDEATVTVEPYGTTKYRVEATPVTDCFELDIIRYVIIRGVGTAPGIEFINPGPQCNPINPEDLLIRDTLDIPDTEMTFHSSEPDNMRDMDDLWPGGPIGPGDEIWVMIGDPIGGCYDKKPIVIEFSVYSAGLDSTGFLMCNSGLETADLNTFLVDTIFTVDDIFYWEEVDATGGAFNPLTGILDPTGLTAGDYTFRYIVSVEGDCDNDTSFHTITIYDQPTSGEDNTGEICNVVNLNTLLSGHDAGGFWEEITPTDGAFDERTGVLSVGLPLPDGDFRFRYITLGTEPCINDTATFVISVQPLPLLDAGLDQSICIGDETVVSATGSPATYTWTPAGIINDTPFTPELGELTYTVTAESENGCITVDDLSIIVHPLPIISFAVSDPEGCTPFTTEFTITSDIEIFRTDWSFGDGGTIIGTAAETVSHTYEYGGLYDVRATVTDIYGCKSTVEYDEYITVETMPIAAFSHNPQAAFTNNTEVEYTNQSLFATDYSWDFGDGSETTPEENPIHFFPSEPGDIFYPVELSAWNYLGCTDKVTVYVQVKSIIIFYIPNTFTPDGDPFNNEFLPIFESGYDPYDYHMTIFNRYGEMVFETYDATVGWDGSYGNGGLVDDGVYIWQLDFKEKHSDKRHQHNGHITIMK